MTQPLGRRDPRAVMCAAGPAAGCMRLALTPDLRAREQLKVQNLQHQGQISTSFKPHHSQGTEVENTYPADPDSEVPQEHLQLISLWKLKHISQKRLDRFNTNHVQAEEPEQLSRPPTQQTELPSAEGPAGQPCPAKAGLCLPQSL